MHQPDMKKLWKELNRHGIFDENDLDKALSEMKPIRIGCMVSKSSKASKEREDVQ